MSDFAAPLRGKCALVTGAATGIGKGIATALAAAGARVVVNHNHTPEPAEKLAAAINEAGGTAVALAADVSSRAEYLAMVHRLLAAFGRWDILVNNAAVATTKAFPEVTEAEFDLCYAVNVKSVFHGMQLAYAHMAKKGGSSRSPARPLRSCCPGTRSTTPLRVPWSSSPASWPRISRHAGSRSTRSAPGPRKPRPTGSARARSSWPA